MRTLGITEEDKQRLNDLVKEEIYVKSARVDPYINKYHIIIEADLYSSGDINDVRRGLNIEIDGTEENVKVKLSEVIQ